MNGNLDPCSDEARASFMDALKSIPNDEKGAYLAALSRGGSQLLDDESCISRFLRFERGDVNAAAGRYVSYWTKRRDVFGRDRAYLPMKLTKGSLSESCIALLRAGWIIPLPRDANGNCVCFLDMTIEETRYQHSHEDRLCCFFYVLQVISEEMSAQTKGFALIVLHDDFSYAPKSAIEGFEEILRFMPIRVSRLHLLLTRKMKENNDFFEEFVPRLLKTLLPTNETNHDSVLEDRQHIYIDESPLQVLRKLEQFGLIRQNLPSKIGGGWTPEHQGAWMKLRLTKEEEPRESETQDSNQAMFPNRTHTTGTSLSPEARKRRREAKHSRQKRDRKRCRTKAVNLHIQHLREKQKQALLVQEKLESGLVEAKKIVNQVEYGEIFSQSLPRTSHTTVPCPLSYGMHALASAGHVTASTPVMHLIPPPIHPQLRMGSHGAISLGAPLSVMVVPAYSSLPFQAHTQPTLSTYARNMTQLTAPSQHPLFRRHPREQLHSAAPSAALAHGRGLGTDTIETLLYTPRFQPFSQTSSQSQSHTHRPIYFPGSRYS